MRAGHEPAEVERFPSLGLPLDDASAAVPVYAHVAAALQENHPDVYAEIGQNDLWIVAAGHRLKERQRERLKKFRI